MLALANQDRFAAISNLCQLPFLAFNLKKKQIWTAAVKYQREQPLELTLFSLLTSWVTAVLCAFVYQIQKRPKDLILNQLPASVCTVQGTSCPPYNEYWAMELAAQTVRWVSGFLILLYCAFLLRKFYNVSAYRLHIT